MLFWSIYNLAVLTLAVIVCFEHPRQAHTMSNPVATVSVETSQSYAQMFIKDVHVGGATLIGASPFEPGQNMRIDLPHIGEVSAIAVRTAEGSAAVSFELTDDQRSLLIARLHASKAPPGVVEGCVQGVALGLAKKIAG